MTTIRIPTPWRLLCVGVLAVAAGCSNPRSAETPSDPPPANTERGGTAEAETVRLTTRNTPGQRYRTARTLRVEETANGDSLVITSEEVTVTHVLRVDEIGRPIAVRRAWEAGSTTVVANGGSPEHRKGELEGCTLELTQRQSTVEARVLVGEIDIGRQQFIIEGFDAALLPRDPVKRSQVWRLEGPQLSGMNALIQAMGFTVQKNGLTCSVTAITPESVEISLDWRMTAEHSGKPAVLRFTGSLTYDRENSIVSEVELRGGRLVDTGISNEVDIRIRRSPVSGWLDFDE